MRPGVSPHTPISARRRISSVCLGNGGLGPTRLSSPRSTLYNCGSSSRLDFRRKRLKEEVNTFVVISSLGSSGASVDIVRNFAMSKGTPLRPTLRDQYSTGRPLSMSMASATIARTGSAMSPAMQEIEMSRRRLAGLFFTSFPRA